MSWTDEEIDKLFKESASEVSFKYDNAYFKEFEAASLPVSKKGKDFLWMGTALVFIGVLTTAYLYTNTNESLSVDTTNTLVAGIEEKAAMNASTQQSTEANENGSADETVVNNASDNASKGAVNTQAARTNARSNSARSANGSANSNGARQTQNPVLSSNGRSGSITQPRVISGGSSEIPTSIQLLETKAAQQGAENDLANTSTQFETVSELTPNKAAGIDNTIEQEIGALASLPLIEFTPKSGFYVEATGGVSQSLMTESLGTPSENYSSSYGLGVGLESHFGRFSLNTGLNFTVANHQDLELSSSRKEYGFGSRELIDTYNYKNVFSLEMPISLGYNFGQHRLTLGVRPSYIVGAAIDHQTTESTLLIRSERFYGLTNGVHRFGVKPMIGYSFHIQQKWTVGVNVGVQLMQAVDEDFTEGSNNPFPIDGQIYLRRTIRLRNY